MSSRTEIANLALSHCGVGTTITDLGTDRTDEAKACRAFYNICRDDTLRHFSWPFSSTIADLGLVETNPNDEWSYAYAYPADCLMLKRVVSGIRNDTETSRVPYKIGLLGSVQVIFTDQENAEAEYTVINDDAAHYPPDFVIAFSLKLAAFIAPRLTGGDPFKMGARSIQLYDRSIAMAQASAANEEQPEIPPESSFIRARE